METYLHEESHNETTYLSPLIVQTQGTSNVVRGESKDAEQ